jgi:hypothetical protein
MRFRARAAKVDVFSGMDYFILLTEKDALSKRTDNASLSPAWSDQLPEFYRDSLKIIPESQIIDVHWDKPLGRGANGAVYSGAWLRPANPLRNLEPDVVSVPVVLKDISSVKNPMAHETELFLKEVRISYLLIDVR